MARRRVAGTKYGALRNSRTVETLTNRVSLTHSCTGIYPLLPLPQSRTDSGFTNVSRLEGWPTPGLVSSAVVFDERAKFSADFQLAAPQSPSRRRCHSVLLLTCLSCTVDQRCWDAACSAGWPRFPPPRGLVRSSDSALAAASCAFFVSSHRWFHSWASLTLPTPDLAAAAAVRCASEWLQGRPPSGELSCAVSTLLPQTSAWPPRRSFASSANTERR